MPNNKVLGRGMIGRAPAVPLRAAEAYLDFVAEARVSLMNAQWGALNALGQQLLAGAEATDYASVTRVLLEKGVFAAWLRVKRTLQESCWRAALEAFGQQQEQFLVLLDEAEQKGPGSVSWNPA